MHEGFNPDLTYEEFKTLVRTTKLPKELYYDYILHFAEEIIMDIAMIGQVKFSEEMNMPFAYVSPLLHLLKAEYRRKYSDKE